MYLNLKKTSHCLTIAPVNKDMLTLYIDEGLWREHGHSEAINGLCNKGSNAQPHLIRQRYVNLLPQSNLLPKRVLTVKAAIDPFFLMCRMAQIQVITVCPQTPYKYYIIRNILADLFCHVCTG